MKTISQREIRRTPIIEHFVSKIKIDFETGCFNWTAQKCPQGYGKYKRIKGIQLAHRASYKLFKGDIPEGMCVLHKCDNPSCINPDHLFIGDWDVNNKDRAAKGRTVTPTTNLTHCKRGHEFNKENTTIRKNGARLCRICNNNKSMERYYKRKNK